MRYWLIILFSIISFSASAQWWHLGSKKKPVATLPMLNQVHDNTLSKLTLSINKKNATNQLVQPVDLGPSRYSLEISEVALIKLAKHNMRFRVYHDASYNFSDLAQVYIKLNRLSEAKWYFLQSNQISREENDDKHTISNLVYLASVKVNIGDIESARADISEALGLARTKGFLITAAEIETKIQAMEQISLNAPRAELKYAENTGSERKAL